MATLLETIEADLKDALKSRAELKLQTLRMLKSDLQYEMNKTGVKSLADETVQKLIQQAIKKRRDAVEQFTKANRNDLAENEAAELQILETYLPPEVTAAEIDAFLDSIAAELTAGGGAIGKVVGRVMGHFKGQNINGALVKERVSNRLQS